MIRVFNIDELLKADDDNDTEALSEATGSSHPNPVEEVHLLRGRRVHCGWLTDSMHWDKATGSLVKMLTGQKGETLLDIAVSSNV